MKTVSLKYNTFPFLGEGKGLKNTAKLQHFQSNVNTLNEKKLKIMDEMRTYIYKRHGKEIDRQQFDSIEEAEAYGCGICATEIVVPEVKPTKAKEDSTNV